MQKIIKSHIQFLLKTVILKQNKMQERIFRTEYEPMSMSVAYSYDLLSQDCWEKQFSPSKNFQQFGKSTPSEEMSQSTMPISHDNSSMDEFRIQNSSDYLSKKQKSQKTMDKPFVTKNSKKNWESDFIFPENQPYVEKNNNVIKLLNRELIQWFNSKGKEYFIDDPKILTEMSTFVKKQKRFYKENSNWNNSLEAMKKIYFDNEMSINPVKRSYLTRKMAHQMIRMHVIPSIHKNKQIKDLKKSYLYTLKILRLRCFNKDLMLRTETH